jgi:hypothetical protein
VTVSHPLRNSRAGRPPLTAPISDIASLDDPRLGIADAELARLVLGVFRSRPRTDEPPYENVASTA